jgi:chromate reductase, NAD(P)H dehydrogenase (quinone)
MHILGICGSLRSGSINRGLLRAAHDVAPEGVTLEIAEIGDLPLVNEDVERQGWPAPVARLRERAYAADGLLFAVPEYNHGVAAPLKNAVDWISRPEGAGGNPVRPGPRNAFFEKPCAMLGATSGMAGTIRAQLSLRQSLTGLQAMVLPGGADVFVAFAGQKFDGDGNLTDDATREMVRKLMAAFASWIDRVAPATRGLNLPSAGESAGGPREHVNAVDEGVEESFPASDPPSHSVPTR